MRWGHGSNLGDMLVGNTISDMVGICFVCGQFSARQVLPVRIRVDSSRFLRALCGDENLFLRVGKKSDVGVWFAGVVCLMAVFFCYAFKKWVGMLGFGHAVSQKRSLGEGSVEGGG